MLWDLCVPRWFTCRQRSSTPSFNSICRLVSRSTFTKKVWIIRIELSIWETTRGQSSTPTLWSWSGDISKATKRKSFRSFWSRWTKIFWEDCFSYATMTSAWSPKWCNPEKFSLLRNRRSCWCIYSKPRSNCWRSTAVLSPTALSRMTPGMSLRGTAGYGSSIPQPW